LATSASAWRRAAAGFVLLGGVGLIFLFGGGVLGLSDPAVARHWLAAARGPWALPAVVGSFAVLAFLGVPQFVLIAAAVAAFGPWPGAIYSWIGTLVSALVGFALARGWGPRLGSLVTGATISRLMSLIARNGFIASLVIRLVPFAPFVAINMAAGLTSIGLVDFTAGTAIGILPKIALTAVAGDSVSRAISGGAWGFTIVPLAIGAVVWLAATVAARRWMKP
jgi:uncharacterized membrane protein YdjX (TVP38/TMEM64 family)